MPTEQHLVRRARKRGCGGEVLVCHRSKHRQSSTIAVAGDIQIVGLHKTLLAEVLSGGNDIIHFVVEHGPSASLPIFTSQQRGHDYETSISIGLAHFPELRTEEEAVV